MFHTDIASVLSECCICFIHMLQQYVSNVSCVSDICCIEVFHVARVSGGKVSVGRTARAPGIGRGELGDGGQEGSELAVG